MEDTQPLPLDDPRWRDLGQCWGSAERIPDLLRRLDQPDSGDFWGDMFQHLCHQGGTTYSASYAAVPHVVRFADSLATHERVMPLVFVASVERDRLRLQADPAPPWVMGAYGVAIVRARSLTSASMATGAIDDLDARYLLFACAVFMGKSRLAFLIEDLPNLECASCGEPMLPPSED